VHIGLRTADIPVHDLPARNLVFLLDVSGSMASANKLPLLRRAMSLLVDQMLPKDRVAIVVYAGASGVVLPSTSGNRRHAILSALEQLRAGGSTNGGAGIELAYRIAEEHRVPGGINRVILATDGDFNVGVSSRGELARLIEKKRKTGTYLTVLGFGTGNIQDGTMEMLADKGNGNYAYIDSIAEARKVLVSEAGATLATVADDVKLQVEFNPEAVSSYRLIGYENRRLAARDFNDDTKDAGEVGAGHMVTALYEIVPAGVRGSGSESQVDPLRYQSERDRTAAATTDELMLLKLRYKTPGETKSKLITRPIHKAARETPSREMRFATAVAGFGMWLRHDPHWDSPGLSKLGAMARDATGDSRDRMELVRLMRRAAQLSDR
jgi:Ca-activated chloride channel family protein